ncbi:MAG: DUF4974 domain-containing protein [Saprospiraceae bacterium]
MRKKEKNIIDKEAVDRYLNNKGSKADQEKIKNYFASTDRWAELESASLQFWKQIPEELETEGYDEDRLLDRINHLLRLEDAKVSVEKRRRLKWFTYASRIAASLFIPLLLLCYLQWSGYFEEQQAGAYSSVYSPLGARTNFHLPDGSEGWLNGGSTLHFPAAFSGEYREVQLEGEAYFYVKSNPRKPFVVTTGNIRIAALGTSFNVNAYEGDKTNSVTLETGVVELFEAKDQKLLETLGQLDTGFQFIYFKDLDSYRTQEVDVKKITAWKEGKLVFREDPMTEVVDRLNRWYNVDIVIEDKKLETYVFRATFQDETLDEVLKLLQFSSPIKIRETGREMLKNNTFGKRKIFLSSK